ncbi:MAG TPA: ABC transporter permease [Acidimicrobiia bacterium]
MLDNIVNGSFAGLSYGCVYAIIALGLVLTYKTSGVFNLAYGAQAFVAAVVYWDTHVRHGWPIWLAFIFAVFIISPLLGLLLDRVLFRYLRNASPTARLVTVLGLIVAIPQAVEAFWVHDSVLGDAAAVGIVPNGTVTYHPFANVALSRDDLATIIVTVIVAIALTLLFRYSAFGLRMRSVVESPRLTELAGVNSERVSMSSWILCSALAGLGGVLLGPLFPSISDVNYLTLIIAATAAAVIATLTSIPIAFGAAVLLGVVEQILYFSLPTNSTLFSGLRPALPFLLLVGALVLNPRLWRVPTIADPLIGVEPPPPEPPEASRSRFLRNGTYAFWTVVLGIIAYYLFFHAAFNWVLNATDAVILSLIFLSITVFTGIAGEVSLCMAAFAGIGACVTGQLVAQQGMSGIFAALVAAVVVAIVGIVVALPSLRLSGIYLSLVTFGFALFFDNILGPQNWMSRSGNPFQANDIPRPQLGPIDFASNKSFLVLCIVFFLIAAGLVVLIRNGTTGRYFTALRGSETAAASIGISRTRARMTMFGVSAAIAGFGGGLVVLRQQSINLEANFPAFVGLVWVVLVVTLSPRTVQGAIQAGVGFIFFQVVILNQTVPWVVNHVQPWYTMGVLPQGLFFVIFGLGAVTYAKHPEGILEYNTRKSMEKIQHRLDSWSARGDRQGDGAVATPSEAAPVGGAS